MIHWLEPELFDQKFLIYEAENRFLQENVAFDLRYHDFYGLFDYSAVRSKAANGDTILLWFAESNDELFFLCNYPDSPYPRTVLSSESFEILSQLTDLGVLFFKHLSWINHYPEPATYSVFTRNRFEILMEVYRAASIEEAETTAFFLNTRSQSNQYFVDPSEDLNQTWLVLDEQNGHEIEIGSYVNRSSAELFAFDYGQKENKRLKIRKK